MRYYLRYCLLAVGLLLSSCGFFEFDKEQKPADLVKFDEEVRLRKVWSTDISKGQGDKYNRLTPAIDGDMIYVASVNGHVSAFNRENGRRQWREKTDFIISGGVGADAGLVLFGTENASVVAMDSTSGEILWESVVPSEVLSIPQTNGDVVIVKTVDGKLVALEADSGEQRWLYENTVPALSLRGSSSPLIIDNFVIAAFANGTLVSVAIDNGTLRWDERIAIPTGRSEIERLVDIDGRLLLNESGTLVVSSYQGYLAVVDVVSGRLRWRIEESSYNGPSAGFGNIYLSNDIGHVNAYRPGEDELAWSNEQLLRRQLTSPLAFSNYVAVADFEGYVHLLSQVDGRFVGRDRVDRNGVRADMLYSNGLLYVYGNGGKLAAFEIR